MKKILIAPLMSLLVFSSAWALDPPTVQMTSQITIPTNRVNAEISRIIQNKMIQQGFSPTDPRYISTLNNSSAALAKRAALARSSLTGMISASTPTSFALSTAGAIAETANIAAMALPLAVGTPDNIDGGFGWAFCGTSVGEFFGIGGSPQSCLLKKLGIAAPSGPSADPVSVTGPTPYITYCVYDNGSNFCPGVDTGDQSTWVCSSDPASAARVGCPGVIGTTNAPNPDYNTVTRWGNSQTYTSDQYLHVTFDIIYYNISQIAHGSISVVGLTSLPTGIQGCQNHFDAFKAGSGCTTADHTTYRDDGTIIIPTAAGPVLSGMTMNDAIANINVTASTNIQLPPLYGQTEASAALSPDLTAYAANDAWSLATEIAASSSSAMIDYPAASPITKDDVLAYRAVNPDYVPRVGDFVAPMGTPSGTPEDQLHPNPYQLPQGNPAPTMSPDPIPNPVNGPGSPDPVTGQPKPATEIDLGDDPQIGSPSLEAIPTPLVILQPLLDLFPDLKSYSVPGHSAVCPTLHFDIPAFHIDTVMSAHCTILEDNRTVLYSVMLLAWTVLAIMIVLSA